DLDLDRARLALLGRERLGRTEDLGQLCNVEAGAGEAVQIVRRGLAGRLGQRRALRLDAGLQRLLVRVAGGLLRSIRLGINSFPRRRRASAAVAWRRPERLGIQVRDIKLEVRWVRLRHLLCARRRGRAANE